MIEDKLINKGHALFHAFATMHLFFATTNDPKRLFETNTLVYSWI